MEKSPISNLKHPNFKISILSNIIILNDTLLLDLSIEKYIVILGLKLFMEKNSHVWDVCGFIEIIQLMFS